MIMERVIDNEQVRSSIDKIKIYNESEQLIFDKFKKLLSNLKYNYESNNTENINNLNTQLLNKMDVISNIHTNDKLVLERVLERYCIANRDAENILESILERNNKL